MWSKSELTGISTSETQLDNEEVSRNCCFSSMKDHSKQSHISLFAVLLGAIISLEIRGKTLLNNNTSYTNA